MGPVTTVGSVDLTRSSIRALCQWVAAVRSAFPDAVDADEYREQTGVGRPTMRRLMRVSKDRGLVRRLPDVGVLRFRAPAPPFGTSRAAWIAAAEDDVMDVLR